MEEPRPGLLARFGDDPFELCPEICPSVSEPWNDGFFALLGPVEQVLQDRS